MNRTEFKPMFSDEQARTVRVASTLALITSVAVLAASTMGFEPPTSDPMGIRLNQIAGGIAGAGVAGFMIAFAGRRMDHMGRGWDGRSVF